uniref:Uncharacterized protein n=1 Tax=viral metagenome TaxID=1070528 RepID=A0A6M3KVG4_9ZZZZ
MKDRIVLVEWDDACSNSGYYDKDHPEKFNPVRCKTVGHLITKDRKSVVISGEVFDDGDRRHIHTIPRKMVVKITELRSK